MRVRVNGEPREVPEGITVGALVDDLVTDRSRIAVERNRAIVPRGKFDEVRLRESDEIEVVTLMGGG